jgi:cation-transporting P-type ATPase C
MSAGVDQFRVCHATRHRWRIKIHAKRLTPQRINALEEWLTAQTSVERVKTRTTTGSIIIFFKPKQIDASTRTDLVRNGVVHALSSPLTPSKSKQSKTSPPPAHYQENKPSLFSRVLQFSAVTLYSLYVLVRKVVFKAPVVETPLSTAGIVAATGTLPLLGHAWHDIQSRKRISLFPFLSITSLLAILGGEALTALEVVWVTNLSMLLEEYAADRSRRAIRQALQVAAKDAYVLVDGIEVQTPVSEVRQGDTVVIHTGEKISVDGTILKGEALVDESHITGRAEPEYRVKNDNVYAGTIVQQGLLFIRAEKVGEETYLRRSLHLVELSLQQRTPAEQRADQLTARLFRLGCIATIGTLLFTRSIYRAFNVLLVMSCPCASVLAASTAVTAAIANAARQRILIKGGMYLEQAGKADCFCFDKTGTLTVDQPQVMDIVPCTSRQSASQILTLAAIAESHNPHPLGKAIVAAAQEKGILIQEQPTCEFLLGRGVKARYGNDSILVGNALCMKEEKVDVSSLLDQAKGFIRTGHTVIYVAKNGKAQGVLSIMSSLRPGVEQVLRWLRSDGVNTIYLVTGDTKPVAKALADKFDFTEYGAELLPDQKATFVSDLSETGHHVVMVGDGVNDALAISKATTGIAMGAGGSEVAIQVADIALVDSDITRLITLRQISHQTMRIIDQNHWLAVGTNIIGIVLGAGGWLRPVTAGLIHITHTLGIMVNSSRLLHWKSE